MINAVEVKVKRIKELIKEEWGFEDDEKVELPNFITIKPVKRARGIVNTESIGSRSTIGLYLKHIGRKFDLKFKEEDYELFITQLMSLFCRVGWLREFPAKTENNEDIKVYRLGIDSIIWCRGDEKRVTPDYIGTRGYKSIEILPNRFFSGLYRSNLDSLKILNAE